MNLGTRGPKPDHAMTTQNHTVQGLTKLEVDGEALRVALTSLSRIVGSKTRDQIILSYTGEDLRIEIAGADMMVPAKGRWTGRARISGAVIFRLSRLLPSNDRLPIRIEEGTLYIGRTALPCDWEEVFEPSIPLPLNLTDIDVLKLARKYSPQRLAAAGISARAEEAEEWLSSTLDRAAQVLEPLGIRREMLEEIVERRLREGKAVGAVPRTVQERLELEEPGQQLEF